MGLGLVKEKVKYVDTGNGLEKQKVNILTLGKIYGCSQGSALPYARD